MSHTHEFLDVVNYTFEDVLVAEFFECDARHCEAQKPVQYEVDFTSFTQNGDAVDETTAEDLWNQVCAEYGTDYSIAREKALGGGVEIETRSGGVLTFEYSGDELRTVTVELNSGTVSFDVEFYRELSVRE